MFLTDVVKQKENRLKHMHVEHEQSQVSGTN